MRGTFARLHSVDAGLERLRRDLESGQWHNKYESLLKISSKDFGYRLVVHMSGIER